MPPENDPTQPDGEGTDPIDDAIDGAGAGPASPNLSLTPDAVRNSPEFKALMADNRKLRRDNGTATAQATAARQAAETARQAAEAQQQAALEAQITEVLGADGVAAWTEIAELSATDQAAAARRFAELMSQGRAQNATAGEGDGDPAPDDAGGNTVPATTPPPPSRGVDGGASLAAAPEATPAEVAAGLEGVYTEIADRVQDPALRNRVTAKDRARGFISYLGASYLKQGAQPRSPRG